MTAQWDFMGRRSFLALPALLAVPRLMQGTTAEHHFRHDHVLGTSLDLAVWSADPAEAERAADVVWAEVARLNAILNTRDPESEISRFQSHDTSTASPDLERLLALYSEWNRKSGGLISVRPAGQGTPLNIDALGKAYIIDQAVKAARAAAPGVESLVLNIGGDIVVSSRTCEISVADPGSPYDNASGITSINVRNAAVASSGTYARGAHLIDARSGRRPERALAATVVAADAVTANALALALCVSEPAEGLRLVEATPGAAALRLGPDGTAERTLSFAHLERPSVFRPVVLTDWPSNFQMTLSLTLTEGASRNPGGGRGGGFGGRGGFGGGRGRGPERPYVAVWVENAAGKLVRVLAFWASKPRYFSEMSSFWAAVGRDQNLMYAVARATRPPGNYQIVWDGLDDQKKPLPTGSYKIVVETNQEHGTYAKQSGTINCADAPAMLTLSATANFEEVAIQYGPKSTQA